MVKTMYGRKAQKIDYFLSKIPFTYNWFLKKIVSGNPKSILDVGCGTGFPMEIINSDKKYKVTGIDIHKSYLDECREKGVYYKLVNKDVRKISYKAKSFDVVICLHLIEHLNIKDAINLIHEMEKIAKRRVVLALPVGNLPQEEYDENLHQKHISSWKPNYFKKRGYRVVGQGLKYIYGKKNVVEKYGFLSIVFFITSYLAQPLLFLKPEWGVYMFCYKNIE